MQKYVCVYAWTLYIINYITLTKSSRDYSSISCPSLISITLYHSDSHTICIYKEWRNRPIFWYVWNNQKKLNLKPYKNIFDEKWTAIALVFDPYWILHECYLIKQNHMTINVNAWKEKKKKKTTANENVKKYIRF